MCRDASWEQYLKDRHDVLEEVLLSALC
jgi:hypothetical protein